LSAITITTVEHLLDPTGSKHSVEDLKDRGSFTCSITVARMVTSQN